MMKAMCQFLIVIFVLYLCKQIDSASVHVDVKRSVVDAQGAALFFPQMNSFCHLFTDLTRRQHDICKRSEPPLMKSVANGANLASKECAKQFENDRWDCSSISITSKTMLGRMRAASTREAAFNYALVAAGIVHTLARDCMRGDLSSCHCSRAKRPQSLNKEYQWKGCGDNIHFASEFSKKFLNDPRVEKLTGNAKDTKLAGKLLMDDHNNQVGRQVIFKKRQFFCKCHGATGHCTTQTCWHQVPKFSDIGDFLKEKYRSAIKTKLVKRNDGDKLALKAIQDDKLDFTNKLELIYTEDSPTYCIKDSRVYSPGTTGRSCNATLTGPGSCRTLCCGRGHKLERKTVMKECRCKFNWCCSVVCDLCKEQVDMHICK